MDGLKEMKMTIRKLVLLLAIAFVTPAMAQQRITVDAIETSAANIILPGSVNGMMTFKPCGKDCKAEYKRARLTENTIYTINGRRVKFSDFRREFATIRLNDRTLALVQYATNTNTVTNIDIIS
jgi:hypothetical protein